MVLLDESYLFKYCPDQIIRYCIPDAKFGNIFHSVMPKHVVVILVVRKLLQKFCSVIFIGPHCLRNAHMYCQSCDRCQQLGKISQRNEMSLNPILVVEIFDIWGIDFMGLFSMSHGYQYILVIVDYVSKWIEIVACKSNDHKVVANFLKEIVFYHFGFPRAIISDRGKHFCNCIFEVLLKKYYINHRIPPLTTHRLVVKWKSLTEPSSPF